MRCDVGAFCQRAVVVGRLRQSRTPSFSKTLNPSAPCGLFLALLSRRRLRQAENRFPLKVSPNFPRAFGASLRLSRLWVACHQAAMVAAGNSRNEGEMQ